MEGEGLSHCGGKSGGGQRSGDIGGVLHGSLHHPDSSTAEADGRHDMATGVGQRPSLGDSEERRVDVAGERATTSVGGRAGTATAVSTDCQQTGSDGRTGSPPQRSNGVLIQPP